jgi:hypothetical protein
MTSHEPVLSFSVRQASVDVTELETLQELGQSHLLNNA